MGFKGARISEFFEDAYNIEAWGLFFHKPERNYASSSTIVAKTKRPFFSGLVSVKKEFNEVNV